MSGYALVCEHPNRDRWSCWCGERIALICMECVKSDNPILDDERCDNCGISIEYRHADRVEAQSNDQVDAIAYATYRMGWSIPPDRQVVTWPDEQKPLLENIMISAITKSRAYMDTYLGELFKPDPAYEKLVEIYKEYYDRAETIDRSFPHAPAQRPRGGVIPHPEITQRDRYVAERRALMDWRQREVTAVAPATYDAAELNRTICGAVEEGMKRHEDALVPCGCQSCRLHRGGR